MTIRTALRTVAAVGLAIGAAATGLGTAVATAPAAPAVPAVPAPAAAALPDTATEPAESSAQVPAICTQRAHVICASLGERRLRYFENGSEWLSAEVRYGRPGYETPKGTWRVTTKSPNAWWSYPYRVYMPWGMKYDDRIGLYLHYSSGFALNPETYVGSHGCIQIGDWETIKRLYHRAPVGTTVHVY